MEVLSKISSFYSVRDEQPNIDLAIQIVENSDREAIVDLIENLSNKNKNIQNDCIKVLYEIGERSPQLINNYLEVFIALLDNKNNRLQWGGMTAICSLVDVNHGLIHEKLPILSKAAENGSVITKDGFMAILMKLCHNEIFRQDAFTLFLEHLKSCPTNQLPMYAENAIQIIDPGSKFNFLEVLNQRLPEIEKESKKKRVEKVMLKCLKL